MPGKPTITPLLPRILASLALVPATVGLWLLSYLLYMRFLFSVFTPPSRASIILAFLLLSVLPVVVFFGGSLAIWWTAVRWTPDRRRRVFFTIAAFLGLMLVTPTIVALAWIDPWEGIAWSLAVGLLGGAAALVWITVVCHTPRRAAGTRAAPCPNCGYDLRGQRECRCPECGTPFTIGEIMASTREP